MRKPAGERKLPKNWSGPGRQALQLVLEEEFGPWRAGLQPEVLERHLRRKGPWREREREPYAFFCPLCRAQRKLPEHPDPWSPRSILQIGLCTAVFALAASPWLGFKGWVAFVPFWMVFEIVYRLRMRAKLRCGECGFDPVLYLSDVQRARREVESHWRRRFEEQGIPYPESKAASGLGHS